ncbi:MAG: hypothetical protein IPJ01_10460 [Micavibrio sp.]|nr:hypothetical protein [Micavibrio sp.]
MKKYKYEVKYLNGKEETFYCNNFNEAIIKAMAKAYDMAWDWRIESITDENGHTISDGIKVEFAYTLIK